MLNFKMNTSLAAGNGGLGQKGYRAAGLGSQERFIVWCSANGAGVALLLLGAGCYFAYDLFSARFFEGVTLQPLRLQLEGGGALLCGVIGLPLLFLQRKWRDLAVFLQGGVPLREAQERMGRLDSAALEESLNDVAKDFLREHPAEVEAWRQQIADLVETQLMRNERLKARLKLTLTPETLQAVLDNRVAIARVMLTGASPLAQLGRLFRLTGHVYTKPRDRDSSV